MTHEEVQQAFDALMRSKLTESERQQMRAHLLDVMKVHPVSAPFYVRASDWIHDAAHTVTASFSVIAAPRAQLAFTLAAALILGSAGTSYAAENALPGDVLYPVKIHVNESIQNAIQTSPQQKAQWSATVATRRLEEAETLAAKGTLTNAVQSDLTKQVDQATTNFNAAVAQLSSSSSTASAAESAQTNMQAALDVHAQVLSQIASAVPQSIPTIEPLLAQVEAGARSLDTAREQQTASLAIASSASEGTSATSSMSLRTQRVAALHQHVHALAARISLSISTSTASTTFTVDSAPEGAVALEATDTSAEPSAQQSASFDQEESDLRTQIVNQIKDVTGVSLSTSSSASFIQIDMNKNASSSTSTKERRHRGDK